MSAAGGVGGFSVRGAVVLVTGASRGIGKAFACGLVERGAARVYGGARDPGAVRVRDVVPVRLDITDPVQVAAAADRCADVTLLVNNAGIFRARPLVGSASMQDARDEMETNFFGTLSMTRAFAPVLAHNGGGAIINVLSVLPFVQYAPWGSYGASKSAAWALTNIVRDELAPQRTHVMSVHSVLVDTDMTVGIDLTLVDADMTIAIEYPKLPPGAVVDAALDALETGRTEVLVDEFPPEARASFNDNPRIRLPLWQRSYQAPTGR